MRSVRRFRPVVRSSVVSIVALTGLALPARAQLRFDTYADIPVGSNPWRLDFGDLDGDGLLDVVTANRDSGFTALFSSAGAPAASRVDVRLPSGALAVQIADIDGDGLDDVLALTPNDRLVRVLRHTGSRSFEPYSSAAVPEGAADLESADLSGDGVPDIAVAISPLGLVYVMLGSRAGIFGPPARLQFGISPVAVTTGDLDGDGDVDLATASRGWTESDLGTMVVRLNGGTGIFSAPFSVTIGSDPSDVVAADLDGDGDLDAACANRRGPTVEILRHDGPGTFASAVLLTTPARPDSVAAGDVDGDGDFDLLASMPGLQVGQGLLLARNDGGFAFAPSPPETVGVFPRDIAFADFDLDGLDDAMVTMSAPSSVAFLRALPGAAFANRVTTRVLDDPTFLVSGDLDRDGDADLVVGHPGASAISIHLGDGAGAFAPGASFPGTRNPGGLAVADLDQDSVLDIVALDSPPPAIRLYRGAGDGTFAERPALPAGPRPRDVAIADFDGNGALDIAVIPTVVPPTIEVHLNRGGGAFAFDARTVALSATSSRSMITADLDADGLADLAVTDTSGGFVHVLFGRGDGSFETAVLVSAFPTPFGLAPIDFDGDGDLDILVSNDTAEAVTAVRNRGRRSFEPAGALPVGAGPEIVRVADFDRDGIDDAAVQLLRSGVVAIFRGTGSFLEAPFRFGLGALVTGMAAVDADRDGLPDIVAVDNVDSSIVLLRNSSRPPEITARYGTVNRGRGAIENVLFANDSTGDGERRVSVSGGMPLSLFMALPPAATSPQPFVLFGRRSEPGAGDLRPWPRGIGTFVFPTPLTDPGGTSAVTIVNNVPRAAAIARLGAPLLGRPFAPATIAVLPASRVPPGVTTLQGAIFDPGTSGFRMSVTNAIVIVKSN